VGYEIAVNKAWEELSACASDSRKIIFLGEEYSFDLSAKQCICCSGRQIKQYPLVLLLHYAIAAAKGIPAPAGEWISFRELPSGEFYYPAFRKRAVEPLLLKYGDKPRETVAGLCGRLPGIVKEYPEGDVCLLIEAFPCVPVKVIFRMADEEFPAEAVMLFDRNADKVFCTEDIAVLGGILAVKLSALA